MPVPVPVSALVWSERARVGMGVRVSAVAGVRVGMGVEMAWLFGA